MPLELAITGKRSGVTDDKEGLSKLSPIELVAKIKRWWTRLKVASTSHCVNR